MQNSLKFEISNTMTITFDNDENLLNFRRHLFRNNVKYFCLKGHPDPLFQFLYDYESNTIKLGGFIIGNMTTILTNQIALIQNQPPATLMPEEEAVLMKIGEVV